MQNIEIKKLDKTDFDMLFELMQQSFPHAEYRIKERQYAILDDENYSVYVYKSNSKIYAFIACWLVDNFIFVEHLAVSPSMRGNGVGSAFMKEYLKQTKLPVVLEIEDIETDIAKRRISFYQRLGFSLTNIRYNQHNLDHSDIVIPLRIMYYGKMTDKDLSTVEEKIFKNIYLPNGESNE